MATGLKTAGSCSGQDAPSSLTTIHSLGSSSVQFNIRNILISGGRISSFASPLTTTTNSPNSLRGYGALILLVLISFNQSSRRERPGGPPVCIIPRVLHYAKS